MNPPKLLPCEHRHQLAIQNGHWCSNCGAIKFPGWLTWVIPNTPTRPSAIDEKKLAEKIYQFSHLKTHWNRVSPYIRKLYIWQAEAIISAYNKGELK